MSAKKHDYLYYNSLRSVKQTAVWRLSSFSSGKFCELRDFAYGQNLYVLYAKFPPPKAKRLQLVMPPTPQGRMIAREQGVPRPKVSAFRPRHNIIGPKLCNRLPPSSLAPKTSIRRGKTHVRTPCRRQITQYRL